MIRFDPDMALPAAVLRSAPHLGAACLILYVVTITLVSWFAPAANWDLVAYTATAIEHRVAGAEALHGQAYAAVRDAVTEGQFLVLTGDRPYRVAQYHDANAFASMLGFYRVKFLFVELAAWLSTMMHPVEALRLISTASCLAVGLLALAWTASRGLLALGPLVVALLVFCDLGATARLVTPDLFAGFFVVAGVLLFVRGNDVLSATALLAATLTRPDHLALMACMLAVAVVIRRGVGPFLVATVVAGAASAWISQASGHPGWWVHMWFNFVEGVPTLEGFDPAFSLTTYVMIVIEVVVRSLIDENWLGLAIVLAFTAAALLRAGWRPDARTGAALAALLLCELGKLVVTPFDETRFHFAYLVCAGLLIIDALNKQVRAGALSPTGGGGSGA
ncbi:MAG: hypothetical protein AB7I79_01935 [Rhizobiaceae bacterium]